MTKTVMFIHGAWLTPAVWDGWRRRFEEAGYVTTAPAWPGVGADPEPGLGKLDVGALVEYYAKAVAGLEEPPVLVGHSFGGLIVQMLLDRGIGLAGIAIDPAPARGILPGPAAIWTSFPILAALNGWNRVFRMSPRGFARRFANGLPAQDREAAYTRQIVPAPGRPFFQAALGLGTAVRWSNEKRPPLLLMAAEMDRTVEAGMVHQVRRRYEKAGVPTDFRQWPGRSHFLVAEPSWHEIADAALEWIASRLPAAQSYDRAA